MGQGLVRFSVNPNWNPERFAAQLALARVHPCLIALERAPGGYAIPRDATRGWFELHAKRGFAGYGLSRALRMLLDVLGGLSALEDTRTEKGQPFAHGELAPAMIRVDPMGRARLIPLAPWHWSAPGTLPAAERHGHLAPERLLGDVIDTRADVFSAGALLWESLAGRRLFETESVDGIVMRLMGDKIALPELPPELSWAVPLKAVAMCALSADPEQRFANCAELADAITAVAGDRVATHAEVADFFRAAEPANRPSVMARPAALAMHHSSLSALVAPLQASKSATPGSENPRARDATPPVRRLSRSVWAIAAISCVVGALGASAVARFGATLREHRITASAPVAGTWMPSLAPVVRVPPAQSAALTPAPVPTEAEPIVVEHASPPKESPNRLLRKPSSAAKSTSGKPRAPVNAGRAPDKAAAKYGI